MTVHGSPSEGLRPERRPDVEAVDVDGELVLWDPALHKVHRLDPLGSVLWPLLDGDASLGELATDAADVWEIPREQALDGLVTLYQQLEAGRLLTSSEVPPPADADEGYLVDPPSP